MRWNIVGEAGLGMKFGEESPGNKAAREGSGLPSHILAPTSTPKRFKIRSFIHLQFPKSQLPELANNLI